jgi:hypothetical protein
VRLPGETLISAAQVLTHLMTAGHQKPEHEIQSDGKIRCRALQPAGEPTPATREPREAVMEHYGLFLTTRLVMKCQAVLQVGMNHHAMLNAAVKEMVANRPASLPS